MVVDTCVWMLSAPSCITLPAPNLVFVFENHHLNQSFLSADWALLRERLTTRARRGSPSSNCESETSLFFFFYCIQSLNNACLLAACISSLRGISCPYSRIASSPSAPINTENAASNRSVQSSAASLLKVGTGLRKQPRFCQTVPTVEDCQDASFSLVSVHYSLPVAALRDVQIWDMKDWAELLFEHLSSLCIWIPTVITSCCIFTAHFVQECRTWWRSFTIRSHNFWEIPASMYNHRQSNFIRKSSSFCGLTKWRAGTEHLPAPAKVFFFHSRLTIVVALSEILGLCDSSLDRGIFHLLFLCPGHCQIGLAVVNQLLPR